ncbi:MAG: mechanosensitive ion channel family protein [Bryobacteraceae bacterium]|nr:mechanosensitive ion channel family protein [Bryobacteraceae bacterium]
MDSSAIWLVAIEVLLVWALFAAWFYLLAWLRRHTFRRLARATVKLVSADRVRSVLTFVFRAIFAVSFLLFFPAALTFTLRQFPATREMSGAWVGWFRDPVLLLWASFVAYLPSLAFLVVWTTFIYFLIRAMGLFARWISVGAIAIPGFHPEWAEPTKRILAFLTGAFGLVVAFPYLPGGQSPAFQGVSLFIGVLVSIGSGSVIGNVVSGIVLTYTRAFRIGDRVKIGDHIGDVLEKSVWVTRIRTIKNEDIVIPHSQVLSTAVVNYTQAKERGGLILHTTVTIGYDAPWPKVHQVMIDAALRTEGILRQPSPFVFQTALNDYNVSYEINAYTDRPSEMARIYSDLHRHLQDTFNESGIEILSPTYNQLRDGNRTTIPANYLPADYRPPGFRVER